MNTINISTGFSPSQLLMGQSPCVIPLLTVTATPSEASTPTPDEESQVAETLIEQLLHNIVEAKDNLLAAKVSQAEFTNQHRGLEEVFAPRDKVMLLTEHHHQEYMQAKSSQVAKFMPWFDGPFTVPKANPTKSAYTLNLPNEPDCFSTFHTSLLHRFIPNDNDLFPLHELSQPGPVVTPDGEEEWLINKIMDEDWWLPGCKLAEMEALDIWLNSLGGWIFLGGGECNDGAITIAIYGLITSAQLFIFPFLSLLVLSS